MTTTLTTEEKKTGAVALLCAGVIAVVFLIVGIRIERVYLDGYNPVECSSEDEIAVELTEDAYGNLAGSGACVHVDAVEVVAP